MKIRPYAKAIVSGIASFCGGLGIALVDGQVTGIEWCSIIPATVIAVAGVFGISNESTPKQD